LVVIAILFVMLPYLVFHTDLCETNPKGEARLIVTTWFFFCLFEGFLFLL